MAATNVKKDVKNPHLRQQQVFRMLVERGADTVYGKAHRFRDIRTYSDFRNHVPLITYEDIAPLIERISTGERNILWPGIPLYFAKTSGTTSGTKYIPITRDSVPNHITSARRALLLYMHRSGNYGFADHHMIFLQGSPVLDRKGVVRSGRLSGIVAHHVPYYLQKNRMPSWKTNCIEDWETKVDAIVEETMRKRMSLISGIPSWLRMYFEKLVQKSGRPVGEIFPDFSVLVYGGLNFEPYRNAFDQLIGRPVDTIELYPASEGFIAYQDEGPGDGLLLNVNSGLFFEFIPAEKAHLDDPPRIPLEDVETGRDYAIIISSNAGLWAYNLGDLVRFVSKDPYRLIVTGRVSQFISAFGEHVIASEVESALAEACSQTGIRVDEFHVAPMVNPPEGGLPYHQWIVEFGSLHAETLHAETLHAETLPAETLHATSLQAFIEKLDHSMCRRNPYYDDLIAGKVLQPLKIVVVPQGTFREYLKHKGKLGGQNKVPRIADNRDTADELLKMAQDRMQS